MAQTTQVEVVLMDEVRNHCDNCECSLGEGRLIGCTHMCATVENVVEQFLMFTTNTEFDRTLRQLTLS